MQVNANAVHGQARPARCLGNWVGLLACLAH